LQRGAARISAGDHSHRVEIRSGDGLEGLTAEFNRMVAQFQESHAKLQQQVDARTHDVTEAVAQQTATSEILRVISRSQTDVQPVFDTIVRSAVRLCDGLFSALFQFDGELIHFVAQHNFTPEALQEARRLFPARPTRGLGTGRAILERAVVHIPDVELDPEYQHQGLGLSRAIGWRSGLFVPMLQEGAPIGGIAVARAEARPFSDSEIELLKTFADQAVIAIENVRLFQELQVRNHELTDALEQQTATSQVLGVISSSPTNLEPVYEAILASIMRLCEANIAALFLYDGEVLRAAASQGTTPEFAEHLARSRAKPSHETTTRLAARDRRVVHVADLLAEPTFSPQPLDLYRRENVRTVLSVPLLRENNLVGVITTWRREVRPFSDKQIALVRTFADQAVIAIENVRLFEELQERNRELAEALEQQTATSGILRVISGSPTNIQPVLDAVAASAARVCGATDALIMRVEGQDMRRVAHFGSIPLVLSALRPITRDSTAGRAILECRPVHVHDILATDVAQEYPESARYADAVWRTTLAVPLVREGVAIGAITIRRTEVRPFADKQIAILQTFADQAVIAIENVRLFQELEARNRELTQALDQQTATSEILRVISSAHTDAQPVFDTIVKSAVRLCNAATAAVFRVEVGCCTIPRTMAAPPRLWPPRARGIPGRLARTPRRDTRYWRGRPFRFRTSRILQRPRPRGRPGASLDSAAASLSRCCPRAKPWAPLWSPGGRPACSPMRKWNC
jgi:GAF domain-containing protein